MTLVGALLGLVGGSALVWAATRTPWARRPRLDDRVAPYVAVGSRPSRLLAGHGLRPSRLRTLSRTLDRVLGGRAALARRLQQAGGRTSLEEFRTQQVLAALVGALPGAALLALRGATGAGPAPIAAACLVVGGLAAGIVARDAWLGQQVRQREEAMLAQFPAAAELLALAVAAGEGPVAALERVAGLSRGELGREFAVTLADARAGAGLVASLEGLAARTTLPALARFVDGIAVALERGTPLAEVLRAQAFDVREAGRRRLLEIAGRREIAMMFPVK